MKNFSFWNLCLAVMLSTGYFSCAQTQSDIALKEDEQLIEYTTDRFTLPNLHVTPNKKYIIFDVLGDIYQVPIDGGKAEILLQDSNWKRGAKLSPDGKTLAYISDETGKFQVWTYDLKSHIKQVYPIIEHLHYPLFAYWGRKNELFIPSKDGLRQFNIVNGQSKIIRPTKEKEYSITNVTNRTMMVNYNGTSAYFQREGELYKYNIKQNYDSLIKIIPNRSFLGYLKPSLDNKKIVFYKQDEKDNSILLLMKWDMGSNDIKTISKNKTVGISTNLNYSLDYINDSTIILDKEGEVVKMDIETGKYVPIPIEVDIKKIIKKPLHREPQFIRDSVITASVLRNPVTKPDLDTIYFGAFGKLHTYTKTTRAIKEVYPNKDRFEVSPSLSPDGKYLAFTTWNDWEMGHLYVRDLGTGMDYQITKKPGRYINPTWSPSGNEIVFIADETEAKMGVFRQTPGTNTSQYHLDIHKINVFKDDNIQINSASESLYRIHPHSIIPKRFYPIPVYDSSGKSIYINMRNTELDLPILANIKIKEKKVTNELLIPFNVNEIIISPNKKYLAFILDERVWIDKMPVKTELEFYDSSKFLPKILYYKGGVVNNILLPNAKPIYEIAPSYLYWQDEHTLMWGSADEIYTYDVRSQETKKIASIKVQKPRAVPKAQYALKNTRIITMNQENQIIEDGTILVRDNRIEAVGETTKIKIPKDYKIFDLSGKTIIPGLIDVHAHLHHGPYEFTNQQEYQYIGSLAYGITTAYDPHSNTLDYREQAQMVEIGKSIGPRIFSSGNVIHFKQTYASYFNLNSLQDVFRLENSFSKLQLSGPIKNYNVVNSVSNRLLFNATNTSNYSITTHQDRFLGYLRSVLNGSTSVEHNIDTPIREDVFKLFSHSSVNFTPTYVVIPGIGNTYYKETDENKLIKFNGELLFSNLYEKHYGEATDSILMTYNSKIKKDYQKSIEQLRNLVKYNTKISVGGHGDPLPGVGTHYEIWFLTNGMSNYQALKAATINGAEKLDLQEEIGSLETGKLADLVVLNKNPLDNIFNTADIKYTILNGYIYNADNMKSIFPETERLRPWGRDSPIVSESMQNIYRRK